MSNLTELLANPDPNDSKASEELAKAVYEELRIIARSKMAKERPGHTLQPTILVNDAWLKLFPLGKKVEFKSSAHFFGTAARVMRNLLVDHARKRLATKRGGKLHKTNFSTEQFDVIQHTASDELVEAVDEVLKEIFEKDKTTAALVELRFFVGLTEEEVADVMGISVRCNVPD